MLLWHAPCDIGAPSAFIKIICYQPFPFIYSNCRRCSFAGGKIWSEICKNFWLTVAERCSHAETNSQTGSDISWGGFEGVKSVLHLGASHAARTYPGPGKWLWKGGSVTYFAQRRSGLLASPCLPPVRRTGRPPCHQPAGKLTHQSVRAGDIFANFFTPQPLPLLKLQLHAVWHENKGSTGETSQTFQGGGWNTNWSVF